MHKDERRRTICRIASGRPAAALRELFWRRPAVLARFSGGGLRGACFGGGGCDLLVRLSSGGCAGPGLGSGGVGVAWVVPVGEAPLGMQSEASLAHHVGGDHAAKQPVRQSIVEERTRPDVAPARRGA